MEVFADTFDQQIVISHMVRPGYRYHTDNAHLFHTDRKSSAHISAFRRVQPHQLQILFILAQQHVQMQAAPFHPADRVAEIEKDKTYLDSIIKNNAEKAQYFANKTLRKVQKKVGFPERPR